MNLIFNDATSLQVQKVEVLGGSLRILAIGITSEQLRKNFSDSVKTKKMYTEERGQKSEPLEGYIEYDHTEEYPGNIYGIVMNQVGKSTEERLSTVEGDMKTAKKDIKDLQEGGTGNDQELIAAAFVVARYNAQALPDREALKAREIYNTWQELVDDKFTAEKEGYKFTHEDVLYKTIKPEQEFQAQWVPGQGTESIFERIDETHAGTLDDPIPYKGNMTLVNGRYYIQDGVTYKCNRDTEIPVHQTLKDLVGIYVEVVE